jgi:Putative adhesin
MSIRHSHTLSIIVVIVAVFSGIAAFLALGGWKLLGHPFEDTVYVKITEARVVGGGSGSVMIQPGTESQVTIHRIILSLTDQPDTTSWIEGSVLYLHTAPGPFCVVSYVIDTPQRVRVTGSLDSGDAQFTDVSTVNFKNGSGNIQVSDASGTVQLSTGSGNIQFSGVTGSIIAASLSGSITGQEVHSVSIKVTTSSGKISLDLIAPGNVWAQTSSGGISLTVPDRHYCVTTKIVSGYTHIKVTNHPLALYHLDLSDDRGNITVVPR